MVAIGDTFAYRAADLDFDLELESGFDVGPIDSMTVRNLTTGPEPSVFTFQLGADIGNTATLELSSLAISELGGAMGSLEDLRSGGRKSILSGPVDDALSIADEAQSMLLREQARLGSFINTTLESNMNTLTHQENAVVDVISVLESADIAEEHAIQAKNDILVEQSLNSLMQGLTSFSSMPQVLGRLI